MNERETDLVMGVIRKMFKLPESHANLLREELRDLNLRPVQRDVPKWVDGAREVAKEIIKERGQTTVLDVLEEYPLPIDANRSMA